MILPVHLPRRSVLAMGASAAVLTACASGTDGSREPTRGAEAATTPTAVPAVVPFPAGSPDAPGDPALGIPALYSKFPTPPRSAFTSELKAASPIRYLAQTGPDLVPDKANPWYRQLTALLGGTELQVIPGTYADYTNKLQVMIAGNDLPDVVMMPPLPRLPDLLASKFTDLTPYLAGDGVKQFPGLASTPTDGWRTATLNGRIWGTVNSRVPSGVVLSVRGDRMLARGIDPATALTDGEAFVAMMKELGDPARQEFAFGEDPVIYLLPLLLQMMGAPNNWAEKDGTFTHAFETEQYRRALEVTAQLWKAGVFHPSSITDDTQIRAWFDSGVTMSYSWSLSGWSTLAAAHPDWNVVPLHLPRWDGGGAAALFDGDSAYYAYNAIPKQKSEDRLMEILHVLDRISAPWGSEEYLKVSYGVAGEHYSLDDGKIVVTSAGKKDVKSWIGYAGVQAGQVLYNGQYPELARRQYEIMKAARPTVVRDASKGLYSDTWQAKQATIDKRMADIQYQIIQGNAPIAAWDQMITEWRSHVGDMARKEFADAHAASR